MKIKPVPQRKKPGRKPATKTKKTNAKKPPGKAGWVPVDEKQIESIKYNIYTFQHKPEGRTGIMILEESIAKKRLEIQRLKELEFFIRGMVSANKNRDGSQIYEAHANAVYSGLLSIGLAMNVEKQELEVLKEKEAKETAKK